MQHLVVTKSGKIIGTEEKIDLQALVTAVQNAYRLETHFPELTDCTTGEIVSLSRMETSESGQKDIEKY